MATVTPDQRLYRDAKLTAQARLGGERAYQVLGGVIRRMAVANALLSTLALQDDGIRPETVRALLDSFYDQLTSDPDFQE